MQRANTSLTPPLSPQPSLPAELFFMLAYKAVPKAEGWVAGSWMMNSEALNILSCVNGPFKHFRNQMGEKSTLKALKRLTPVSSLKRDWNMWSISRIKPFTLPRWDILFKSSRLDVQHPHAYGFVSPQDSTQELGGREVMNGVQTELFTAPRTKDALRYFLHASK